MIINNAASRSNVGFWTKHLQNTEENERAELKQIRGLEATNLHDALLEMQSEAADRPRLKNFMYHADFNPCPHERLTEQDWERAFEIFEKQRGIPEGTPRIVYEHEKEGRIHRHAIWARLDPQTMRAFPDGLDAKIAHTAARKIEFQLGLEKVIGPFDREPGTPRPPRAPEPWEMYRGMQTRIDPLEMKTEVTALRKQSQNGKDFHAALEQHGYQLVTGRRGLLILDSAGKEHSLAKRSGITMKELDAFMRDVDREALPTVEQGKAQFQDRKIAGLEADRTTVKHEIEWEEALAKAAIAKEEREKRFIAPEDREKETRAGREQAKAPELGRTAGEIRLAYSLTQTGPQFANALEDRGLILAQTTEADAERLNRWEAQRLREHGREQQDYQKYRAGELAVLNQHGDVFKLTRSNTGDDAKARAEHLKDIDRDALLSVTAAQGAMRKSQQHRQEEREKEWQQKRERPAQEEHWPINAPQPERKSPGLFGKSATEATRDDRKENLHGAAAQVWAAWQRSDSRQAFAAALDDKGIAFAVATKDEADRSHREAEFARGVGNYAPRFKEGEIVIITEARPEYRRDGQIIEPRRVHKIDQSLAAKFVKGLDSTHKLQGIDATIKASDNRGQQRAADWQAIRLDRATDIKREGTTRAGNTKDNLVKSPRAIVKPVTMGLNVIGKPLELLGNLFEGVFAAKLTPEQIHEGERAARERQADARDAMQVSNITTQRVQERQQEENEREAERRQHRARDGGERER